MASRSTLHSTYHDMGARERLAAVFGFTAIPVTILTLAVYAAVFISIAVLDELPAVPSKGDQLGLDIDRAYADLHKVLKIYISRLFSGLNLGLKR